MHLGRAKVTDLLADNVPHGQKLTLDSLYYSPTNDFKEIRQIPTLYKQLKGMKE